MGGREGIITSIKCNVLHRLFVRPHFRIKIFIHIKITFYLIKNMKGKVDLIKRTKVSKAAYNGRAIADE
jgi:hypothetical protein